MKAIENLGYRKCDETQTLPCVPKLSFFRESQPNAAISLDVLFRNIQSHSRHVLVLLNHGDLASKYPQVYADVQTL